MRGGTHTPTHTEAPDYSGAPLPQSARRGSGKTPVHTDTRGNLRGPPAPGPPHPEPPLPCLQRCMLLRSAAAAPNVIMFTMSPCSSVPGPQGSGDTPRITIGSFLLCLPLRPDFLAHLQHGIICLILTSACSGHTGHTQSLAQGRGLWLGVLHCMPTASRHTQGTS